MVNPHYILSKLILMSLLYYLLPQQSEFGFEWQYNSANRRLEQYFLFQN